MKNNKLSFFVILILSLFFLKSCGPIILAPYPDNPPPAWFYPNRIESVRYVYFPDYVIYYDLSLRQYIYLENNVWIRVNVLPLRYRSINLNRSRYVRVRGYRDTNIRTYHRRTYTNSPRSSRTSTTRSRRN
ncbi:hypothetical protein H2O64_23400 [Kordia sp. YSTF-M3]|uniref:Lipoprotein n=1 Tax=Kordia aestuariivivens TaxID=2759037 RepID=A0ABR7QGC9_9FLAO|nr:hypothetical protein [Kordia aestuariivivens]MBC8757634.1 hypothetical protein [Kordia aestuariivivens]